MLDVEDWCVGGDVLVFWCDGDVICVVFFYMLVSFLLLCD